MSEKVDNRPSLFFITCFQKIDTDKLGWLDMGDSRVFGFKETFEQADSALKNNVCDMYEYLYSYAVVEEMKPAIHPDVENRWFYEYDKEKEGFFPINEPEEFKHFCNIALG